MYKLLKKSYAPQTFEWQCVFLKLIDMDEKPKEGELVKLSLLISP